MSHGPVQRLDLMSVYYGDRMEEKEAPMIVHAERGISMMSVK